MTITFTFVFVVLLAAFFAGLAGILIRKFILDVLKWPEWAATWGMLTVALFIMALIKVVV